MPTPNDSELPVGSDGLVLPCPFCGAAPRIVDDYDERSGWGQRENGWVQCRCGANIGAPSPSSPYPTLEKAEVIARWNRRQNTLPLALEVSTSTATPSVAIRVSAYHLEGMQLAALASVRGGGTPDRWASLTLSARRLPKPPRPYSFPDRPTGHTVTITLPRERFDELDARAARDGLPLREWIHAALVAASRKYRATLDTRPAPPAAPYEENVIPFFTGPFRRP